MKQLKIGAFLSIVTVLLIVACTARNITEPEAIVPVSSPTMESENATREPTLAVATAVPLPTNESTRSTRLTPVATPQLELVPTLEDTAVIGEVPEAIMTAIYQDLIAIQNVPSSAITVTQAKATIWNDGALGCPQPGEVYTQAVVNGYWIVLEGNGRSYNYHAAENGYFILCQNSLPPSPPVVGTPIS